MTAEHAALLPLERWPSAWGEPRPRRITGMLWVAVALWAVAAVMIVFAEGSAGRVWSGAVLVLFGATALLVAVRRPFGRGRMRLIEASRLVRAGSQVPEVRALFVAERPAGVVTMVLSTVWALVLTAATAVAVHIGFAGRPQAFLGAVAMGFLAVLFAFVSVRAVVARFRFDSFGRRRVGLALGPHGVTIVRVTETVHLPWEAIRAVEADLTAPRRGMEQRPVIRLRVDPKHAIGSATVTVLPAALQVHPLVVWSALRGFHRTPSARAMLGTQAGQELLGAWSAAAPGE
ncbi:hypothetical protein [Microbacterium sp.]|uniref:hypothetical protein n=1 Tax=Microbacterium sp. TaxID=51671 RepID=UPI0039E3E64F